MYDIKRTFTALIIFVFMISGASFAEIQFFPDENLCKNPHGALLRSPSLDALYIHSEMDHKDYLGYNFGTKIPVLSYDINAIESQFGGFGGIYTRFELFTYSFNFVHADFQGGVFNDFKYNRLSFEFMLYHVSSHLGDDYVNKEKAAVTDTGFEAVRHYTTYAVFDFFEITAGFEYKFARRPDEKIINNKSFLIGNRLDLLKKKIPLFLEWEFETDFHKIANIGIKCGVYLSYLFNNIIFNTKGTQKEKHELSVYYYYGYSKMGYFYDTKESLFLVGPTYRF